MKISIHRVCTLTLFAQLSFCAFAAQAAAQATPTTTTLAVTSAGTPVTSVASGSVVTLTATVKSGSAAVTVGQVNFCDASATYCTDIHLLGTAQLTSAGTGALSFESAVTATRRSLQERPMAPQPTRVVLPAMWRCR